MNISLNTNSSYTYNSFSNVTMQSISKTDESETSQKVLGYEVDSKGYFKSDFNKAAGIPEDFKIHSDTMKSLVSMSENASYFYHDFSKLDIAKTAGNAYKILTQLVDKDTLSKDSFTREDLAKIPQGYVYNNMTMEVTQIHQSMVEHMGASGNRLTGNLHTTTTFHNRSFMNYWNTPEGSGILKPSTTSDMFTNNIGGKEGKGGLYFNSHGEKYTNSDGSVTKGGLLVGIMNENFHTREGETTWQGKLNGLDKQVSSKQARLQHKLFSMMYPRIDKVPDSVLDALPEDMGTYMKNYKKNFRVANGHFSDSVDQNSNESGKTNLDRLIEEMVKNQKEMLESIKKKAQETREENLKRTQKEEQERLIEQNKMLDEFTKEFLKTQNKLNQSLASNLQTDITSDDIKNVFSDIFGLNKKELFQKSYLDLMA